MTAATQQRTRYGGVRRTGVAQIESASEGRSYGFRSTRKRSEGRNLPPVLIKWREPLGLPDCPYLIRWRLETPLGSIRLHHWLRPDDDRAFHDHPWWFATLVLAGGYTDKSPDGEERLTRGAVRYRPALHRHTVVPDAGGAWTLLLTGPRVRAWGFWDGVRFIKANKWFLSRGHHPCAEDDTR